MSGSGDLRRFAAELRTVHARLGAAADKAEFKSAHEGLRIAHQWSSGTYSLTVLATVWGHPYSHRGSGAIPYGDPGTVNIQTGRFYDSWRVVGHVGGALALINDSPEAVFMAGTRFMIQRPIRERVEEQLLQVRIRNLRIYLGAVTI